MDSPPDPSLPPVAPPQVGIYTFPTLRQVPLEPLAVAALALSPLAPVGLGCGILALGRIRRNHTRGRPVAVAGILVSSLVLVGLALTVITLALNGTLSRIGESATPGDAATETTIATVNLAAGNCVATLPVSATVGEVRIVPCANDHLLQVVATPAVEGQTYPGQEALFGSAALACSAAVEAVAAGGDVEPWFLVASEQNWDNGYRHHMCLIRSTAGPVTTDVVN